MSNIESCTEDSRLLLNLQACPDVAGTESTGLSMNNVPHIFPQNQFNAIFHYIFCSRCICFCQCLMTIYLQLKSSLVWLHGEMAILDIWLDWFHIIMPFQMKNVIDALFTKKSCQMVIDIFSIE